MSAESSPGPVFERRDETHDADKPHEPEARREHARLERLWREPLLTLEEVADFLRVDPKTVRRWVAARRIPCLRIGTRIRFDPGDLVSWVRRRKEG